MTPIGHIARQMQVARRDRRPRPADVLVLVCDVTDPRDPIALPRKPDLVVISKCDLSPVAGVADPGSSGVSDAGYRISATYRRRHA